MSTATIIENLRPGIVSHGITDAQLRQNETGRVSNSDKQAAQREAARSQKQELTTTPINGLDPDLRDGAAARIASDVAQTRVSSFNHMKLVVGTLNQEDRNRAAAHGPATTVTTESGTSVVSEMIDEAKRVTSDTVAFAGGSLQASETLKSAVAPHAFNAAPFGHSVRSPSSERAAKGSRSGTELRESASIQNDLASSDQPSEFIPYASNGGDIRRIADQRRTATGSGPSRELFTNPELFAHMPHNFGHDARTVYQYELRQRKTVS